MKKDDGKVMMNESVMYLVTERKDYVSSWYFSGTLEECINYIKTEIRERNKQDGYDEYWHNLDLMIVKRIVRDEEFLDFSGKGE